MCTSTIKNEILHYQSIACLATHKFISSLSHDLTSSCTIWHCTIASFECHHSNLNWNSLSKHGLLEQWTRFNSNYLRVKYERTALVLYTNDIGTLTCMQYIHKRTTIWTWILFSSLCPLYPCILKWIKTSLSYFRNRIYLI